MIKSMDKLSERLSQGLTFTKGHGKDKNDEKVRWFIAETGETIHAPLAERAIYFSVIAPVQSDMFGEPMQWGHTASMERVGR